MKVLVTGGKGQLGIEVTKLLIKKGIDHKAYDSDELNVLDQERVKKTFVEQHPNVIFHCAAYTDVDKAEDKDKKLNWEVNVTGTKYVAQEARAINAKLVYISTDYVFDGDYLGEYKEYSETNPKNEYGKAKLAGERIIEEFLEEYYIIRTSWMFGKDGHNFVNTMKYLAQAHQTLQVVSDQVGKPTWTKTLAEFMLYLIETKQNCGIYHLSNEPKCTWYEFAREILKDSDVKIKAVTSGEFPQKAYRPKHSVMNLEKAKDTRFKIPNWREVLENL